MADLEKISVNLIATAGNGFDVSYLLQGRNAVKTNLKKGAYPFYWPGALSVFGGRIEHGETPEQGALREIREELKLEFNREQLSATELRTYEWSKESTLNLYQELDDFFHGNMESFFGPDLYSIVPSCVLGKEREKFEDSHISATYFDWLRGRTDHYLVADFKEPLDCGVYEGVGRIWLPHWATRAIVTTPCDKLALLDDMMRRVKSGKLQIEPPTKK
ncbi:MAG: NUDIX domain-containing protein [Nanoarchaeota archaeon]